MLVCLEQSGRQGSHSDMRVDSDQAEPQWPWGELEIPPMAERKPPKRIWAAEWNAISQIWTQRPRRLDDFPGAIGQAVSSRAQAFGLMIVFPSDDRLQGLSLVLGGPMQPVIRSLLGQDGLTSTHGSALIPVKANLACLQLPDHSSSPSQEQGQPFLYHLPWAKPAFSTTQFKI